ncbi:hypothetical protein ACF0H5_010665 [Mactra antiquata]
MKTLKLYFLVGLTVQMAECVGKDVDMNSGTDVEDFISDIVNNKTTDSEDSKDILKNDTYALKTEGNKTEVPNVSGVTQRHAAAPHKTPDEGLPIPIMVASPAVAVCIIVFICVAYKLHTKQLDEQAKQLAIQVAAGTVQCPSPILPSSPSHTSQRLLPQCTVQSSSLQVLYHSESDFNGPRRKSLRTPSPTSQILLTPNMGIRDKRGSSWSALSDNEIVNHSPRRHSTFLL